MTEMVQSWKHIQVLMNDETIRAGASLEEDPRKAEGMAPFASAFLTV